MLQQYYDYEVVWYGFHLLLVVGRTHGRVGDRDCQVSLLMTVKKQLLRSGRSCDRFISNGVENSVCLVCWLGNTVNFGGSVPVRGIP